MRPLDQTHYLKEEDKYMTLEKMRLAQRLRVFPHEISSEMFVEYLEREEHIRKFNEDYQRRFPDKVEC